MMKIALAAEWEQLPIALKRHYQHEDNNDIGTLTIEYPRAMQLYLNVMRLFGVLINRRGDDNLTVVSKTVKDGKQYWRRTITFPDGKQVLFNSYWVHDGGNELIEYVNAFIGLRMAVQVKDGVLHYEGKHVVLKLGSWLIRIPEWLVLGHTTIVETALDDDYFVMDFKLRHPLFGVVFRYAGRFRTTNCKL